MEGAPGSQIGSQEIPHKYRIMVSVGERVEYDPAHPELEGHSDIAKRLDAEPVHWGATKADFENRNQLNAGEGSYVISAVDESNKESSAYGPCTGVVAIGVDKATGNNLSLLTHQAPNMALEKVNTDLAERLRELMSRSRTGSVDIVVFGGSIVEKKRLFRKSVMEDEKYKAIAKNITNVVMETTHLTPRLFGPNTTGYTNVIVDTKNRRLYMEREPGRAMSEDFDKPASEVIKDKK